jgi:hypothetical protein
MGKYFSALGKAEQAAVSAHVRAEYEALVQTQASTYATRHAQVDPAAWQEALCELIAGDRERVEATAPATRYRPPRPPVSAPP